MKLAVIKTGGKQYKVREDDTLKIEKLNKKEGEEVIFEDILLFADTDKNILKVGNPYVKGVSVKAKVLKNAKTKKGIAFKYKPKVRYRKKIGHRQPFTEIKITSISL